MSTLSGVIVYKVQNLHFLVAIHLLICLTICLLVLDYLKDIKCQLMFFKKCKLIKFKHP